MTIKRLAKKNLRNRTSGMSFCITERQLCWCLLSSLVKVIMFWGSQSSPSQVTPLITKDNRRFQNTEPDFYEVYSKIVK